MGEIKDRGPNPIHEERIKFFIEEIIKDATCVIPKLKILYPIFFVIIYVIGPITFYKLWKTYNFKWWLAALIVLGAFLLLYRLVHLYDRYRFYRLRKKSADRFEKRFSGNTPERELALKILAMNTYPAAERIIKELINRGITTREQIEKIRAEKKFQQKPKPFEQRQKAQKIASGNKDAVAGGGKDLSTIVKPGVVGKETLVKSSRTVVRANLHELEHLEFRKQELENMKANGDFATKVKSGKDPLIQPAELREGTLLDDEGTLVKKHIPELTGIEIAEQEAWEIKVIRKWQPGEVILDTYKVEEIIKTGGMGYVYIAEHQKWKVKMAIKSPNEVMLSDKSLFSRVLREADAWTELGLHPHIAYCYYVRKIEEIPHIFIEYVDGGNLNDWIANGKCYNLKVGLDIAIQICHGMEHAHSFGMIHRDIKPENILMTKYGIAKVTDFGIAGGARFETKSIGPDEEEKKEGYMNGQNTNLTSLAGTYDYMSPEQYKDSHNVDKRADIYSFGVCLYEMFCGKKPYGTATGVAISALAKEEKKPPYEPIALRKDMPQELALILKKCCELEREKRYSSFADLRGLLVDAYKGLFHDDPIHAKVDVLELKADGLNNRAVSYLDLGRENDARRCWEEALQEDPQHLEATFNLGYLRWQRGEITDDIFLAQFRELETSKGNNPNYCLCLAWIHFERGDVEAVDKILKEANNMKEETFQKALKDKDRPIIRLHRILGGHKTLAPAVSFSPDNRYAISVSRDIILWNVESGREVKRFEGHKGNITSVSFSPDGRYALTGGRDCIISLWDIEIGREVNRFEGHKGNITSVSFSSDGHYALSGGASTTRLWEVESGKELKRFGGNKYGFLTSSSFFSNDHYIFSIYQQVITLWHTVTGKITAIFKGPFLMNAAAISASGKLALVGSPNNPYLLLLDFKKKGSVIRRFEGHTEGISSVSFSPNGIYALSASLDNSLILWDVDKGKAIRRFDKNKSIIIAYDGTNRYKHLTAFSPNGCFATSADLDKTITIWRIYYPKKDWSKVCPYPILTKVTPIEKLGIETNKVKTLLKSANNFIEKGFFQKAYLLLREGQTVDGYQRNREILNLITTCGIKGNGSRIGIKNSWGIRIFKSYHKIVRMVVFCKNSRYALTHGRTDFLNELKLWDINTGAEIKRFKGDTGNNNTIYVAFSPDGRYILAACSNEATILWDIKCERKIMEFGNDKSNRVRAVCFSPDGRYVLTGHLRLWDVEKGMEIKQFEGHKERVIGVGFSIDGHYAFSWSHDTIIIWDIANRKEFSRFDIETHGSLSMEFSPCGRYLIIYGREREDRDWSILIWDMENKIRRFKKPKNQYPFCISPRKSNYILSCNSEDRIARLWDMETEKEIRRFEGHKGKITSIIFTPDGRYAISGGIDKTIRLWAVDDGIELERFEGHASSILSLSFSSDAHYLLSGCRDGSIGIWEFDWEWAF